MCLYQCMCVGMQIGMCACVCVAAKCTIPSQILGGLLVNGGILLLWTLPPLRGSISEFSDRCLFDDQLLVPYISNCVCVLCVCFGRMHVHLCACMRVFVCVCLCMTMTATNAFLCGGTCSMQLVVVRCWAEVWTPPPFLVEHMLCLRFAS